MPSCVSIGCQGGGPETRTVGRIKVPLYHALSRHVTSTHCDAIDEYGLVLRVDGSLDKFGDEGIERLRFAKKQRYITVDIQIPEECWKPLNDLELRRYLSKQVRASIAICVARLQKDGYSVDDAVLMSQVDAAIGDYTSETQGEQGGAGQPATRSESK